MATFKEIREDRVALASAMQGGRTVNIDGYELGFELFSEVSAVKMAAAPHTFAGACLIVQVDRAERPSAELAKLAGTYANPSVCFAREEPFWKEIPQSYQIGAPNLFAVTSEWLAGQAGENVR
jgi:hypothetical protein